MVSKRISMILLNCGARTRSWISHSCFLSFCELIFQVDLSFKLLNFCRSNLFKIIFYLFKISKNVLKTKTKKNVKQYSTNHGFHIREINIKAFQISQRIINSFKILTYCTILTKFAIKSRRANTQESKITNSIECTSAMVQTRYDVTTKFAPNH